MKKKNKGVECTHGEKDMQLTIGEGPESLTNESEIDMVGTRKPLKVTEPLLVSCSQEPFS